MGWERRQLRSARIATGCCHQAISCQDGSGAGLAVWTRNNHHITVGVAKPHFSVVWSRIEVGLLYDQSPQCLRPFDDCVEVLKLEPEQDAVSRWRCVGVDEVGMIFLVPSVELKNQVTAAEQPIIHVAMAVFRE